VLNPGSQPAGCHFHISLRDAAGHKNLFLDVDDPRGLGVSRLGYQFLAGAMAHARWRRSRRRP
jgi:glutamine synthetase